MGAFYGDKIQKGEINPRTGEAWKIEDVGSFWRPKTLDWLKSRGYDPEAADI